MIERVVQITSIHDCNLTDLSSRIDNSISSRILIKKI